MNDEQKHAEAIQWVIAEASKAGFHAELRTWGNGEGSICAILTPVHKMGAAMAMIAPWGKDVPFALHIQEGDEEDPMRFYDPIPAP